MSITSESLNMKENKIHRTVKETSKWTFIVLILVVLGVIIARVIKKVVNQQNKKSVDKKGIKETDSYYTPVPAWGPTISSPYYFPESNGFPVSGTKNCQIYTYENVYAENEIGSTLDVITNSKPNINTVFEDYVNGLNHTGGLFSCISQDQIYAKNVSRICNSDNSKYTICYDSKGTQFASGTSVSFPVECSSSNLKSCDGRLGSISLNFKIEDNKINQQTRCIGISTIRIPPKLYDNPSLQYYREDGILQSDSSLIDKDYYPVTLISDICNTRDSKQKFLITNYRFGNTQREGDNTSETENTFVPDNEGIYTSIIYKPLNAYLDMEFSGSGGLATLELGVSGTGYQNIEYDIVLSDPSQEGKNGRVTVVTEGNNGAVQSLIISELGTGYQQGISGYVSGSTGTSATFVITSVYETNPQFVLRKIKQDFEDVKWLFFPSLDLSTTRFPEQQRCNFINPLEEDFRRRITRIIKRREFSLLSSPLDKNTIFTESYFPGDPDTVSLNPGYCSNIRDFYPEITFRNLTSAGRLNPFNEYKYSVLTKEGNPPVQKNKNPFELKRKETITNLSPGNTFTDGTAEILVEDFSTNICQFPSNYFKNTRGSVLSFSPNTTFDPNDSSGVIYKNSDVGLIDLVIVSKQPSLQGGFLTGNYQGVSVSGGNGTSATFDVEVNSVFNLSQLSFVPKIKITNVRNQGANYDIGDLLKLDGKAIGLKSDPELKVEKTELEKFLFISIPMDSNYLLDPNPLLNFEDKYPNRDFSVIGTIGPNNNFEIFEDLVVDRGFGMKDGYTMWMIQLDLNSNSIINQTNYNNLINYIKSKKYLNPRYKRTYYPGLIGIVPDSVQTNEYSGSIQAPVSLGVSQNQTIEFNFLQNSKMVLNPSPQQFVYGGEIVLGNNTLIEEFVSLNINNQQEIINYFLGQKSGLDTDVVYLKSLQYPQINYSTEDINQVNTNTEIVLGKFIPYSSFTPMVRGNIEDGFSVKFNNFLIRENFRYKGTYILPKIPGNTLYNNNYTQIIPYGLDEVYNTDIKYGKESGSDNPYNNITQG